MSNNTVTMLKWLDKDLRSCHGGSHQWKMMEWVTINGPLIKCENGIHVCDPDTNKDYIIQWITKIPVWIEVDLNEDIIYHREKVVCRRARIFQLAHWNEKIARLLHCDILEIFKNKELIPIIEAERKLVAGLITSNDLKTIFNNHDSISDSINKFFNFNHYCYNYRNYYNYHYHYYYHYHNFNYYNYHYHNFNYYHNYHYTIAQRKQANKRLLSYLTGHLPEPIKPYLK